MGQTQGWWQAAASLLPAASAGAGGAAQLGTGQHGLTSTRKLGAGFCKRKVSACQARGFTGGQGCVYTPPLIHLTVGCCCTSPNTLVSAGHGDQPGAATSVS